MRISKPLYIVMFTSSSANSFAGIVDSIRELIRTGSQFEAYNFDLIRCRSATYRGDCMWRYTNQTFEAYHQH